MNRRVCRVQPDVPAIHRAFDYLAPGRARADVRVGTIVRVPLHGRRVRGWVLDADVAAPEVDARASARCSRSCRPGRRPTWSTCAGGRRGAGPGPLATFLRAASPPNVIAAGVEPELETAVYPPSLEAAGVRR